MSKKFDIGEAEVRLGEVKPLQMPEHCDWFVGETGYSETGCGSSGWLDPTEYENFRFCPLCGEEIRAIRADEEEDDE